MSRLVALVCCLALALPGHVRGETGEVRAAQQFGLSYLALMIMEDSELIQMPESARDREQSARTQLLESLADFDDELLTQLLVNLVENGLRHTPAGSTVTVTLARRDVFKIGSHLTLAVGKRRNVAAQLHMSEVQPLNNNSKSNENQAGNNNNSNTNPEFASIAFTDMKAQWVAKQMKERESDFTQIRDLKFYSVYTE